MKFILMWLIASFVVFYTRFSAVTVLDVSFFLGVVFTGLLWTIGIGIALIALWIIVVGLIVVITEIRS